MTAADETWPGPTVGVEEEFFLVDPDSGRPLPEADQVLADLRGVPPARYGGAELQRELLACQVEAASAVCRSLTGLAGRLHLARRRLAAAAHRRGALLISSGTPPAPPGRATLSRGDRFRRIAELYAGVVPDYHASGCHVHVGVRDRETAVAVTAHLRPWLPTLLALSANSPHHDGEDTGYASWRMVQQSRFPGSGVPPVFDSAAAYDREVARLVDCGALVDERMSFWLVRPSARFPTLEFRVADAAATCDEAVLQAALARALVRTAVEAVDRGRPAPRVSDQVAAAAVWSAARHGLHGSGVDPFRERRVPATELVAALLAHVRPALEATGDRKLVDTRLRWLTTHGDGAARQRRHPPADRAALLRHLAEETVAPPRAAGPAPTAPRTPGAPYAAGPVGPASVPGAPYVAGPAGVPYAPDPPPGPDGHRAAGTLGVTGPAAAPEGHGALDAPGTRGTPGTLDAPGPVGTSDAHGIPGTPDAHGTPDALDRGGLR
ncbi:carboxylate-amine ligase [Streptomyces pactum]|uniref:carboxylate-amine ligase n=1 Tax=Streptomyces pactum TaxID=68249 RepID=UPI0036FCE421